MARRYSLQGEPPYRIQRDEVAPPKAGHNQLVVRMKAASLNYRDIAIQAGRFPTQAGLVPLSDGAGVIEEIGPGVEGLQIGDRVVSCFYPFWESGPATAGNHRLSLGCEQDGILADLAVLPATAVVPKPDSLDFEQAATLPCAALTAWSALFTEGQLRPGQAVVIQGTGGVALFALQFTKMAGARAIVLSSDDGKLERARALGADELINYKAMPNWSADVLARTDGLGADVIVELGGAETLNESLQAVKVGGCVSVIGVLSGVAAAVNVGFMLFRHIRLIGITVGHRQDFLAMNAAIDSHRIDPVIDRVFGFDEVPAAYELMPRGAHFGKLVVRL